MTRAEAIKILKEIEYPVNGDNKEYRDMAFKMAIKALEQEFILDKIKAEIEAVCCITVDRECDGAITLHDVFDIIDKYKAESEE